MTPPEEEEEAGAGDDAPGKLKYVIAAGYVRGQVADGTLKPGQPVPSAQALARTLGFSKQTVRCGLDLLLADGTLMPGASPGARLRVAAPPSGDERGATLALSAALAAARHAAEMTQPDLATRLDVSVTAVGHAETGRVWHSRGFWERADKTLGAGGELVALHDAYQSARAGGPAEPRNRERDAAGLWAQGLDAAEIAGRLGIGVDTAREYVWRARGKAGASSADVLEVARQRVAEYLREEDSVPAGLGLTGAERRAVRLLGEAYTLIEREVVAGGPNRDGDLTEVRAHVHAVQNAVRAQASARLYPAELRLLGETLPVARRGP